MELKCSKRAILQSTFGAIKTPPKTAYPLPRPVLERAAVLRRFKVTPEEIAAALPGIGDPSIQAIVEAMGADDPSVLIEAVHHNDPKGEGVEAVLGILRPIRKARALSTLSVVYAWIEAAEAKMRGKVIEAALRTEPAEESPAPSEEPTSTTDPPKTPTTRPTSGGGVEEDHSSSFPPERLPARLEPFVHKRLESPCSWGDRLSSVFAAGECCDAPLKQAFTVLGIHKPEQLDIAHAYWNNANADIDNVPFLPKFPQVTEPIGYLHLERISFVPAGIEHGELVYALPLAPGEIVSIAHKEWSATEEEYLKIISDEFEDYAEQGVVNTTDMSQSSSSERQHQSAFNVSVSVSGGYGPVSGTVNTGYSVSDSASNALQYTLNRSNSITKKASARSRKEHKTSFRLAKKSQVEDQTVRIMRNPDPFNPVRYDFYQVMRKWRVDLHQYGVRLTYDLTIPEPAGELLAPYLELEQIRNELEKGFSFLVNPQYVNRLNYVYYATQYGIELEPPPPLVVSVQTTKLSGPWPSEEWLLAHLDELHVAVPEGYQYLDASLKQYRTWFDGPSDAARKAKVYNPHPNPGLTADIAFPILGDDVSGILTSARVWFVLHEDREKAWRVKAYQAIRDAAYKAYLENRQTLEQRYERIKAKLGGRDALTLRKMEREELMKGVLRWLFGPGFQFAPKGASQPYFDSNGAVVSENLQSAVLDHGELVSFLHQAIEWENLNSFLYPYFWSPRERWDQRLRLEHNDAIHEAFLRAGAARVVLPIRPGWEKAFLSVLATGKPDGLDGTDHPYLTIAEELENYAKTNYPGIIPANPNDIDPDKATAQSEGRLIGSWYEYTPTSALDIKIGEGGPVEGDFKSPAFNPQGSLEKLGMLPAAVVDALQPWAPVVKGN